MKTADVMRLLRISRATVYNYRVQGKLHATLLINGHYDYDEKSVFALLNKDARLNNLRIVEERIFGRRKVFEFVDRNEISIKIKQTIRIWSD